MDWAQWQAVERTIILYVLEQRLAEETVTVSSLEANLDEFSPLAVWDRVDELVKWGVLKAEGESIMLSPTLLHLADLELVAVDG